MTHVRELAEKIGPRGSTTPEERAAARYIQKTLSLLGYKPKQESFRSARSAWLPAALFWSTLLAAGFLYLGSGRIGGILALILACGSLASMLMELSFRSNPLRWILPKEESQNVWAVRPCEREEKHRMVFVAHMDTHRTPLVFSNASWVRWFERLVPIGMGFAVLLILLLLISLFFKAPWLYWLATLPMTASFGMLILMLQADFTPFSHGANDNASGVAAVLGLAESLLDRPLLHTSVWFVFTGCEEVGCYGADAFLRRHREALEDAFWITLDNVGSTDGHPVVLSRETFLLTSQSDPHLLRTMESVAPAAVKTIAMKGAYTEGAMGRRHGLRVLTLESHDDDGNLTDWHRPTDTMKNVSSDCIAETEQLALNLARAIDADAPFST